MRAPKKSKTNAFDSRTLSDEAFLNMQINQFARSKDAEPWCVSTNSRNTIDDQLKIQPKKAFFVKGPILQSTNLYSAVMKYFNRNIETMKSVCQNTMSETYLKGELIHDWVMFVSFTIFEKKKRLTQPENTDTRCMHIAGFVFAKYMNDPDTQEQFLFLDLLCAQIDGKGIGKDLLAETTKHAMVSGCAWIELHSVFDKVEYYTNLGFTSTGVSIANDGYPDLLKMRKYF